MSDFLNPIQPEDRSFKLVKESSFEKTGKASELAKEMKLPLASLKEKIRKMEDLLEHVYQKKQFKPSEKELFKQAMWNVYLDFVYDSGGAKPPRDLPKNHPWHVKDIRDELNELRGRNE